ncbi:MAG: twin-arginine translocation signal domain-containing protein [Betaproteobacteria bacterium]|nr:twin-arginine translocation signal domain-containing protein [Betaproteobacteria bacterium]MDH4292807.1 twin-arginine translocation signal domain-containing protein [Betaproteobacteria bacterium]MDH5343617.1 twin-arginine translocation signal domain-containing protein [Betaproteobacteria bacterium]
MSTKMSRRKFLAAVGVGGVATAAVVASKVDGEAATGKVKSAAEGKGYQLTAHVRRYYETTKV